MKVTKKTQYFIDGVQVLRVSRVLAKELGVSDTTLRTWVDNKNFPAEIYTEQHGVNTIKYFPYEPAMYFIQRKLAKYAVNRAIGLGRPNKN